MSQLLPLPYQLYSKYLYSSIKMVLERTPNLTTQYLYIITTFHST